MPVFLYSGPASEQKRDRLFSLVNQHLTGQVPGIVVVPDQSYVNSHKTRILLRQKERALIGQTVMTWDDLLLGWIKHNLPRVHLADQTFCHYLLFLLIEKNYPELIRDRHSAHATVLELYRFFQGLKSCGVGPEEVSQSLKNRLEQKELWALFTDYQAQLRKHHYLDQGDLYLENIKRLKENQLELPYERCHLYISQTYPLKPGQREIIRWAGQNFTNLIFHVFYDEDHTQDFYLFDKAFEDLGSLATETVAVPAPKPPKQPVIWFKNPHHEIQFALDLIQSELSRGVALEKILLVISDRQYIAPLLNRMAARKLPVSVQIPQGVTESVPVTALMGHDLDLWVDEFRKTDNLYALSKLKAQAGLDAQQATIEFIRSRLFELDQAVAEDKKHGFLEQLLKHTTVPANSFPGQIVLTTPEKALAHSNRQAVFLGCHLEAFFERRESTLFSHKLLYDADMAELLESPQYRLKLRLEKMKQWLRLSPDTLLMAPEFDFADKPATRLDLGASCELEYVSAPAPCAPEKQTLASDYYQSKKKNFSLTELEKYAECPYCYYAACHLKLDRPPVDELEPSADVKGSFVHQVLFRLIAENETLYWEGLEYASYREKLVKKLGHVIQEEIDKSEEFKKYHQKMIEFYAYRVYKTISTLLQLESENYKTAKKKTVPRHYEWSFGSDSRKPLVLDTKAGVVQIRGRVDRVDVCQASRQFSVVDYKTGQAPSLTAIKAVKSLQLPAYLIAVQQLLYPDQAPAGAYYYLLKTNEIKGFSMRETVDAGLMHKRSQLGLVEWQDLQDRFVLRLGEIVEGVRAGHFDPNPASAQLCRFCDYKYLCGYRATECEPEDDE